MTWVVCPFPSVPSYEITASDHALIITCIPLQCMWHLSVPGTLVQNSVISYIVYFKKQLSVMETSQLYIPTSSVLLLLLLCLGIINFSVLHSCSITHILAFYCTSSATIFVFSAVIVWKFRLQLWHGCLGDRNDIRPVKITCCSCVSGSFMQHQTQLKQLQKIWSVKQKCNVGACTVHSLAKTIHVLSQYLIASTQLNNYNPMQLTKTISSSTDDYIGWSQMYSLASPRPLSFSSAFVSRVVLLSPLQLV